MFLGACTCEKKTGAKLITTGISTRCTCVFIILLLLLLLLNYYREREIERCIYRVRFLQVQRVHRCKFGKLTLVL